MKETTKQKILIIIKYKIKKNFNLKMNGIVGKLSKKIFQLIILLIKIVK